MTLPIDAHLNGAPPTVVPVPAERMRFISGTLHRNWYIAARSAEVKGGPIARTILEEPLVLWRTKSGETVAQLDRCLHRNAKLSEGSIAGDCIRCPYHGWSFDRTGNCVRVPSDGPVECRVGRRLETLRTMEQDGFVWVFLGEPSHQPETGPFRFPEVGPGWSSYVMTTEFAGDVTDIVENFMDVPHTGYVHKGWFRSGQQNKCMTATVERRKDAVHVTYDRPDDVIAFARRLLNPEGQPTEHTDQFFMPNCTRVDYRWGDSRQFIITSQITPATSNAAIVYTAITFKLGRLTKLARLVLPWYTKAVINQDVAIMRNQSDNLRRFGRRQFTGTEADVIHRHIETLRGRALASEQPPAEVHVKTIKFWI